MESQRPLIPGVYAASLTFFDTQSETLDISSVYKHTIKLAMDGIAGFVVMGSNGEAPHLSTDERAEIIMKTREALDSLGKHDTPIISGCSEQSVRGTVKLCHSAKHAGADYALVLPPCYFRGSITDNVIEDFYTNVANESPLPIILYSFPAVVSGVNMTSDLLIQVSQHPRVVGTKFTCGDTGKLNRVSTAMKNIKPKYFTAGGLADFILPALAAGATGIIAGGGNIAPRTCAKIVQLWQEKKVNEAQEVQQMLSTGDWVHTKMGVAGTKAVLQRYFGYGGNPRRPLKTLEKLSLDEMLEDIKDLMEYETNLSVA